MSDKNKFEMEFLLETSPKVLENMLNTPSGLSEWFAEDVHIKDDLFTFIWDGSEEKARNLSRKTVEGVKWQWLDDEDEDNGCYVEITYSIDPMTKTVVLRVTDFAEEDEVEEAQMLWEQQIGDLKRVLGA